MTEVKTPELTHSSIEYAVGEILRIPDPETRAQAATELMSILPDIIGSAQDEIAANNGLIVDDLGGLSK
jgi:hypothetical protein